MASKKSAKLSGKEAFEKYFSSQLGERWPALYKALLGDEVKVPLMNPYVSEDSKLTESYKLDQASIVASEALKLQPGQKMLDLCSAPGGKSIVQLFLQIENCEYVLNDLSETRLNRLRAVLREHIPERLKEHIKIKKHDGERWALYQKNEFDRIIVDAPCSGERHILQTPKELNVWSETRTKRLHTRQVSLICSAFDVLKPGGRMVYSTCSISDLENDQVVKKLFKKRKPNVEVITGEEYSLCESTEMGYQIWPDKQPGSGPIYFSVIHKI